VTGFPGGDIQVAPLGLGTSALGEVFGPLRSEPEEIVCAALHAGINYFDTAPFYGGGLAEERLGRALHGVRRESYVLSSKVGRYGVSDFDFSVARVGRSVDESLRRLRTDYLDLVYCHDVEFANGDEIVKHTLPALSSLREKGKIRSIGISGLPLDELVRIARAGAIDVVLSYGCCTVLNRELGKWVPGFRRLGVGVINAAPFAMGLLTQDGPPSWHPASAAIRTGCRDTANALRRENVDIAQVALQFAVSRKSAQVTLASARSAGEVEQWATWLANPLPASQMAEVMKRFEPVVGKPW